MKPGTGWIWCWTKSRISVPYQQIYIDKSQNRVDDMWMMNGIAEIESKAEFNKDVHGYGRS